MVSLFALLIRLLRSFWLDVVSPQFDDVLFAADLLLFYFGLLHIDELTHSKLKADLLQVILRTYKTRNQQKLV